MNIVLGKDKQVQETLFNVLARGEIGQNSDKVNSTKTRAGKFLRAGVGQS